MKRERRRCVIISGGPRDRIPPLSKEDFIIVCDRGYEYAWEKGIRPDLAVGDFDSCRRNVEEGIEKLQYPREKDDTDTMLAVRQAIDRGFPRIEICCGMGGRVDHMIANLQTLAFAAEHGCEVSMTGEKNQIYMVKGAASLCLPRRKGWSLSLFSFSDVCRNVTIRGAKYSLEDGILTSRFPLGVSNEWRDETAEISLRDGLLCVILSGPEREAGRES